MAPEQGSRTGDKSDWIRVGFEAGYFENKSKKHENKRRWDSLGNYNDLKQIMELKISDSSHFHLF